MLGVEEHSNHLAEFLNTKASPNSHCLLYPKNIVYFTSDFPTAPYCPQSRGPLLTACLSIRHENTPRPPVPRVSISSKRPVNCVANFVPQFIPPRLPTFRARTNSTPQCRRPNPHSSAPSSFPPKSSKHCQKVTAVDRSRGKTTTMAF
jgi:hypothetical protein